MRLCLGRDFIARAANFALLVACGFYLVVLKNANFPSFCRRKFCLTDIFVAIKFKAVLSVIIKFNGL